MGSLRIRRASFFASDMTSSCQLFPAFSPLLANVDPTARALFENASFLSFVTDPPNGSEITGNDTDVNLKFGTRATFQGITIGTIVCDRTVLTRGTTVCP